ncbi:hypothetical protein TNCV_3418441 [Trichonephila clavipes]|nr:hypothetical protein TNCV_3418441 [Trichonephila clavipes]
MGMSSRAKCPETLSVERFSQRKLTIKIQQGYRLVIRYQSVIELQTCRVCRGYRDDRKSHGNAWSQMP